MRLTEEHFNLLIEANRILSSTLNLNEVLSKIMELAMEIVRSEASSILLLDEKTNELVFDVALGEKGDQVKQIRLKLGEGIAGWVAQEKKSLIVNNVSEDKRWTSRIDEKAEFNTKSIIAIPLVYKGKLLGVVEVINRCDDMEFTNTDLSVLEAFSAQASISIMTAKLFTNLKTEKEKIELMLSQMSDGAIITDGTGEITFANDACRNFIDNRERYLIDAFKSFDVTPSLQDFLNSKDKTVSLEFVHRDKKSFYLSGKINRIIDEDSNTIGYIIIFHDTSEQKKEELLKRNFLSLISHKLRTPLVSVIGYSSLLLQKENKDPQDVTALEAISSQGQYLNNLVDKLLNFTLVESNSMKLRKASVGLKMLAKNILIEFKDYFDKNNVTAKLNSEFDDVMINADIEKLEIVLRNLIENAVKFNTKKDKCIIISYCSHENMSGICVGDNGPGISVQNRVKLFQKFYQIEESFTGQVEGVGLGLALCKLIIDSHDGKIWYGSAGDKGSKFCFVIPRYE